MTEPSLAGLAKKEKTVLQKGKLAGLQIRSVTEATPYLNLMVYGEPGIGKTRLAGSASLVPEMSPVLFIDVEGGVLSLATDYPEVDVVRVSSWEDVARVYEHLYDNPGQYGTVVIDSLSEMQRFSMHEIMKKAVQKDSSREIEVPGFREWGINGEQIRRLVQGFRDMPINVIMTAHSVEEADSRTGLVRAKPSLTGKLRNEVAGFMDIVGYMYRKTARVEGSKDRVQKTFLLTGATDQQVAKDRSGKLPMVMEEPSMTVMYHLINGSN